MSSPLTNLKKTSLASERIIKNGLEFRTKGPIPIAAEVYYVRRNSPPDLIDKENIIHNMTSRLTSLENEMVGVRKELSKAIEVINRRDAEITMLKQQLFPQGNQPLHSRMPVADKRDNKMYEEYNEGYIQSHDQYYYERPNVDWEEKRYDLSDHEAAMRGLRYHVPVESQSAPVLRPNVKMLYCPAEQSKTCNQQEYREYGNNGRGHEMMNYDTVSRGSSYDSNVIATIYDDSYCRKEYKKKIYDATAELAQSRPKIPSVDVFDSNDNYEHMIILGKKEERNNRGYDGPNAVESRSEGKGLKSRAPMGSEYDAYSRNVEDIRASVDRRSSTRNNVKVPQDLQNTLNDNMINEGQLHNEIRSKAPSFSGYDAYSRNIEDIRKSVAARAATRNNIKVPNDLQFTLNDHMNNEGQQTHNETESKEMMNSDYGTYSRNAEEIRKSEDARAAARNSIKESHGHQNTFNNKIIQEEQKLLNKVKGTNDRKSFSEGHTQRRNVIPSSDETSYEQEKPNMKHYNVPKEDDTSLMTEYERKFSRNVGNIAVSTEKHSGSITTYGAEAEELQKKVRRSNTPNVEQSLPEGKIPAKNKLLNNNTSEKSKSTIGSYNEYGEQEIRRKSYTHPSAKDHDPPSKSNAAAFNNRDLSPDFYDDDDDENQTMYHDREVMQNKFTEGNDPYTGKQFSEDKVHKQNMIPLNMSNKTSEAQEKPNMMSNRELEKLRSEDRIMASEYDDAFSHNIGDMKASMEKHVSNKFEGQNQSDFRRNNDPNEETLFSGKKADNINIIPSNKRSSVGGTEEEDIRSDSSMTTEYANAYGPNIEDETLMEDDSRRIGERGSVGHGKIVILNSNKESENFVLGNEESKSLTSEYRDAYGAKVKYVIHQCSTNVHRQEMLDNTNGNIESNFVKLFSKRRVYEPKIIPLNNKTSDGQIELNMKSCNGNEIYSAYLYPDDSISKIWSLTDLNYEEFVVTVDDKVLHINVPLKNYNINGDVTLNISKRKPNFLIKEGGDYKSEVYNDEGDVDYSGDEDNFSDKVDNEEGYSS